MPLFNALYKLGLRKILIPFILLLSAKLVGLLPSEW